MKKQLGLVVVVGVALLAQGALGAGVFGESRPLWTDAAVKTVMRQVQGDAARLTAARRSLESARVALEQVLSACQRHEPSIELDQILMDVAREHQERAVGVERCQAALDQDQLKAWAVYWHFLIDARKRPGEEI